MSGRHAALVVLAGLVWAPAALAQALPFNGRWLLDDGAGPGAGYSVLTVKGDKLSWTGADKKTPSCVQSFVLQAERPGTIYVDGRGTRFVAGVKGSIPTYLLRLADSNCGRAGELTRIRYPLIYDTGHIEVIDYVGGQVAGARRFHRK